MRKKDAKFQKTCKWLFYFFEAIQFWNNSDADGRGILWMRLFFVIDPTLLRNDESYYAEWSRHWLITTPDHPAAIGYLIKLFHHFPSNPHISYSLGLIFSMLTLSIVGTLMVRKIALSIGLDKREAKFSGLLFLGFINLSPYFAGISVISTTDNPLNVFIFFSFFTYYYCFFDKKENNAYWLLAGTLLALALFSKLTAVFLAVGLSVYVLISKDRKVYLKTKGLYLSAIPVIAMGCLILMDDYFHDFQLIKFSLERSSVDIHPFKEWDKPFGVFFSQFFNYSILLIIWLGYTIVKILKGYFSSTPLHLPPSHLVVTSPTNVHGETAANVRDETAAKSNPPKWANIFLCRGFPLSHWVCLLQSVDRQDWFVLACLCLPPSHHHRSYLFKQSYFQKQVTQNSHLSQFLFAPWLLFGYHCT